MTKRRLFSLSVSVRRSPGHFETEVIRIGVGDSVTLTDDLGAYIVIQTSDTPPLPKPKRTGLRSIETQEIMLGKDRS